VFKDAASDETARQLFFSQAVRRWRLAAPGFGVFEGPFLITRLEYSGAHEDEVRFSIALVSAGAVDFDAV
jgi:TP901-1 family phage major tail protein